MRVVWRTLRLWLSNLGLSHSYFGVHVGLSSNLRMCVVGSPMPKVKSMVRTVVFCVTAFSSIRVCKHFTWLFQKTLLEFLLSLVITVSFGTCTIFSSISVWDFALLITRYRLRMGRTVSWAHWLCCCHCFSCLWMPSVCNNAERSISFLADFELHGMWTLHSCSSAQQLGVPEHVVAALVFPMPFVGQGQLTPSHSAVQCRCCVWCLLLAPPMGFLFTSLLCVRLVRLI